MATAAAVAPAAAVRRKLRRSTYEWRPLRAELAIGSRLRLVDNFDGSTGEVAVSCPAGGGASSDGPAGPRERGRLLDGEIAGLGTLEERVEIDRGPPHLLSRVKATRSPAQRGDGGSRAASRPRAGARVCSTMHGLNRSTRAFDRRSLNAPSRSTRSRRRECSSSATKVEPRFRRALGGSRTRGGDSCFRNFRSSSNMERKTPTKTIWWPQPGAFELTEFKSTIVLLADWVPGPAGGPPAGARRLESRCGTTLATGTKCDVDVTLSIFASHSDREVTRDVVAAANI